MEMWAWLIAYLIGFALLQLYLYRYFIVGRSTGDSATEGATPQFEGSGAAVEGGTERIDRPDEEFITCSECGGYNASESVFTYCKHCGERL